jgi:aryl-phospho-beta-D-glucosidase BglC (GH1 family)
MLGIASLLSACGGSGSGAGSSSSSSSLVSSLADSSSSSLAASSDDASSSSLSSASISAALYPSYNTNPIVPDMTGMDSNATELAAKMKLGTNIGNTMEAYGCDTPSETCWGQPMVSAAYVKLVKDSGFDSIRIPVSWDQYADQTTGKISDAWLNRVKEVVQYAVDNGLYVIINIHWDGGWLERSFHEADKSEAKKEAVKAKQKAYWEQIATHFRDFDEHLLFASANEPDAVAGLDEPASVTAPRVAILDEYHQTFVDAVRSTGGKNAYRVLVIQSPRTDIDLAINEWHVMPSDTVTGRQMAEVHFYPFSFTLQDKDEWYSKVFCYWGEGHHSTTDTDHNSTREEEDFVDAQFAKIKTKFSDQGIPVVLGEYGAMLRPESVCTDYAQHRASRAYYAQYVVQSAIANGMLPFYWEIGVDPALIFDRAIPAVGDQQLLDGLLVGAGKLNGSSSSSQSSSANISSSSTEVSSASSSSSSSEAASSASNVITFDLSSNKWEVDTGVVMVQSNNDIHLTLTDSGKSIWYNIDGPIDLVQAKYTVVLNFDSAYVASVNAGFETGILQFFAIEKSGWTDEFICWTGWQTIVAGQDVSFSCDQFTKNNPQSEGARIGVQFFGNTGTVTIKSATLELAE